MHKRKQQVYEDILWLDLSTSLLSGFEQTCEDLRGPEAILSISRDTCSDSIAKLFRACFCGVSHNYRAICCKMGYRTDVPVLN